MGRRKAHGVVSVEATGAQSPVADQQPAVAPTTLGTQCLLNDPERCIGLDVIVHGLVGRPELNGRTGITASYDSGTARFGVVGLQPATLAIKATSLSLTAESIGIPIARAAQSKGQALSEVYEQFVDTPATKLSSLGIPENMDEGLWPALIIPTMLRYRKQHASHQVQYLSWKACERLLPVVEQQHGFLSPEVASVLLAQCNVFQDLKPTQRTDRRYAGRAIEQALRLQRIAHAAPWLVHTQVELIWWEADGLVGAAWLEAEALIHMAAAHQDIGDVATAQISYEQALRLVESAGLEMSELAARVHNFLGTLYQQLAAPKARLQLLASARRDRLERSSKYNWAPESSDGQAAAHMNQALRHALKFLHLCQRIHGVARAETGFAHQSVADICFTARVRKPAEYHSAMAVRILTGVFSRDNGHVESAEGLRRMIATAKPEDREMPLDKDVLDTLSRNASLKVCGNKGCDAIEDETGNRFQQCSRCIAQVYCSRQCQKADWSHHKRFCVLATPVAERQEQEKLQQKVMNVVSKQQQANWAKDAEASTSSEEVKALQRKCLACGAACVEAHCCDCTLATYCSAQCKEVHAPRHSRYCILNLRRMRQEQSAAARASAAEREVEDAKQREAWAASAPQREARERARREDKQVADRCKMEAKSKLAVLQAWRKIARAQVTARREAHQRSAR